MGFDLKRLMAKVIGGGVESADVQTAAPTPAPAPEELPEPAIPVLEMAGTLALTRDFLAERRNLMSGLGWERVERMPEWAGARAPETSGTLSRISWSGVLGDLTKAFPVVGRMPTGTSDLLSFVESRKSLYRYLTGGEGLSLDELLPTGWSREPGENVTVEAATASSAILKRLGEVWGRGTGEKPVSPQRIGRIAMRRPPPPSERKEPALPWKAGGEQALDRPASPVVVEHGERPALPVVAEHGGKRPETAGEAPSKASGGGLKNVVSPVVKAVSAGRSRILRLFRKSEPPEGSRKAESAPGPVSVSTAIAEGMEPPPMPLANLPPEIRSSGEEKVGEALVGGLMETVTAPSVGLSAEKFSRSLAEGVRRIVPDLGRQFPLAGGALLERMSSEGRSVAASPVVRSSKLLRSFADWGSVSGLLSRAREAVSTSESTAGGAAGLPGMITSLGREAAPALEGAEMPSAEGEGEGAVGELLRSLPNVPQAGEGGASEGAAGLVSWAMQIVGRHAPQVGRATEMLSGLSIPTSLGGLEEEAAEALGGSPGELFQGVVGRSLSETGVGALTESIERVPGLSEVTGLVRRPMEALRSVTGAQELPLATPSVPSEATGGAAEAAAETGEGEALPTLAAGESTAAEPTAGGEGGGAPEPSSRPPNLEELTEEVYRRLLRRLRMEREIRGL